MRAQAGGAISDFFFQEITHRDMGGALRAQKHTGTVLCSPWEAPPVTEALVALEFGPRRSCGPLKQQE